MIKKNISVGIDIGTNTTRVVVIGSDKNSKEPVVLAMGQAPTSGMRLGFISDINLVVNSLKKAVKQAEDILGFRIRSAYVSCGGINLGSVTSSGSIIISRSDQEITKLDTNKVIESSEDNLDLPNKKIIHSIPLSYKLDGKEIFEHPEGMHGIKLEVKTLFVVSSKQNIDDLVTVFGLAGIEILDITASPIILGSVLASQKQKIAGCAILDIGAETVSLAVFENNLLISLQTFQIGSIDITKDIALGLRISLEEAESLKHGSVLVANYPKKKIDEIIEARLSDIFELVTNHLKRIRRNELLPAGIIITGGGSSISEIETLAREQLKIPARIGPTDPSINNKFKVKDNTWYVALGLALSSENKFSDSNVNNLFKENLKQVKGVLKSLLNQLMP